uniref:Uncharacterized protein n=1 Tax=Rhizophora mucronata TaxID=61149 RepID=A0A2P2N649_RHIMU
MKLILNYTNNKFKSILYSIIF